MRERLSLLTAIGRQTLATPDLVAHGLVLGDLEAWAAGGDARFQARAEGLGERFGSLVRLGEAAV